MAFVPVHFQALFLCPADRLLLDPFRPLPALQRRVVIVHVMAHSVDRKLAFHPVVQERGKRHHFLLAWLHTQRHTHAARHRRHHQIRQRPQVRVQDQLPVPLVQQRVGRLREEMVEIHKEHGARPSIPAVMPAQVFL